jgi:hypothetical protein
MNKSAQTVTAIFFLCVLAALVWNHIIYLLPVALHLRTVIAGSVPLLSFAVPAFYCLNRFVSFQSMVLADKFIFTVFLAWLIAAFVPILLLTCGILSSAALFAVCGLSLLLSYPTYKHWILNFPTQDLRQAWHNNPKHWRVLFIISLMLGLIAALLPPLGYDAHEYHLAAAQQYLMHGYWIWFEHNVYAAFPMNVEMLFMYPLAVESAAGCTVINLQMALLTGLVIVRLAKMGGYHGPTLMPIVLYLSMGIVLRLIVDAKNDLALAMCAALLLYGYEMLRREYSLLALFMMTCSLGFGLGSKYITILAVMIPFLVMVGMDIVINQRWDMIKYTIIACIGGVLLWSPWLIRNMILYHNPMFPLLTDTLGGTPEIFTAMFSAAHASEIYKVNHGLKPMPASGLFISQLVEFFWLPLRKMILGNPDPMPDALPYGFAVYGVLFPLALIKREWKSSLAWRLIVFSLACYGIWFFATQRNDRFLASLFPVMALLPCLALPGLNWNSPLCKTVYTALLSLVAFQQLSQSISLMRQDTFDFVLFPSFEQEFYDKHLPHYRAITWLNQQQAVGKPIGTVLFVGEAQSYGAQFDAVAPTVFNPHPLLNEINQSIPLNENVTHILYNAFELNRLDRGYTSLGWTQGSPLRNWMEQNRGTLLKPVYDAMPDQPENLVVFEVER